MKLSEIKLTPVLSSIQILDISDEEYFGDKYKEYISNSRLKYIDPDEGGSPESFFDETHSLSSSSITIIIFPFFISSNASSIVFNILLTSLYYLFIYFNLCKKNLFISPIFNLILMQIHSP